MKKNILWTVIVVLIIVGIILVAGKKQDETGPIKIGFIGGLTGEVASMGTSARGAVELAAKEVNDAGGINGRMVEVVFEDGKCNASAAANAAQKLINGDKVDAIIGGLCSTETSAFIKTAMDSKVPVVSYCSSAPSLSNSGKYFFRTYASDSFQGKYSAEYLYNKLGVKKVAILYVVSDWGTGIKDVFTKRFIELGGEITITEGSLQDNRDYKTQLTKIKDTNPDYLYAVLYPEGGVAAMSQLASINSKMKVLGGDAWEDTKFLSTVNSGVDIIYTSSSGIIPSDFKDKMEKAGVKEVTMCAPQAYDAARTIFDSIKKVGVNPDDLQKSIRETNFKGILSNISFDQNGDLMDVSYFVKKVSGGKGVIVE